MKKLLLALGLFLLPSLAMAQCNGVFPNATVCGNATGASNTPRAINPASLLGSAGGTNGQVQYNNSGALGGFTPSGGATINTSTGVVTLAPITSTSSITGASTTYTVAQNNILVHRSNSGSPMVDTLPGTSPGVLAANTIISVTNSDTAGLLAIATGSGSLIKGGGLLFNGFTYIGPGQTLQFYSDGSNYWIVNSPGRAKLGANTTLLIATTGSDTTGNGITTAFATLLKAWSFAQTILDHNGLVVTYSIATGNYAVNTTLTGSQVGSCGPACDIIQGNTTTPANITIGAATGVSLTLDGVQAQLQGVEFNFIAGQQLVVTNNAVVNWQNNITQGTSGGTSLTAVSGGNLRIIGNYQVGTVSSASTPVHWNANNGGYISVEAAGITITVVGGPNWGNEFALAQTGGTIFFDFVPTFSGASTGLKCTATLNGVINTGGTSASLPGASACTSSNGGVVN